MEAKVAIDCLAVDPSPFIQDFYKTLGLNAANSINCVGRYFLLSLFQTYVSRRSRCCWSWPYSGLIFDFCPGKVSCAASGQRNWLSK